MVELPEITTLHILNVSVPVTVKIELLSSNKRSAARLTLLSVDIFELLQIMLFKLRGLSFSWNRQE